MQVSRMDLPVAKTQASFRPQLAPSRVVARPRRCTTVQVCGSTGHIPGDGEPPRDIKTRSAYKKMQHRPKTGSEYGEGFVQLRSTGETTRLDVDTLNERLRHVGAQRLRHSLKPDEAYGMVFNFDSVICDTRSAVVQAWLALAEARGNLPVPNPARLPLLGTCPERIMMDVLGWTRDMKVARELSWDLATLYAGQLEQLGSQEPVTGVRDWLTALTNFNVPCALVSHLDKATVRRALERMHLHDHFQVMVTNEDDMETVAQQLLGAAMQLQRPPDHCVAFDGSPEAVTAAHNCTMRSVAVTGWYKAHQLKAADVTCHQLSDLTVYNVRRLFANRGDDFMDMRKQHSTDRPGDGHRRRPVMNATLP